MRRAELLLSLAFLALAGIVIWESIKLNIGWGPNGPDAGFLPFWIALSMAGGSLVVIFRQARQRLPLKGFFPLESRWVVLEVLLSLAVWVFLLPYMGIYLTSALYLGLFSGIIGRHRWYVALAVGVLIALVLFFIMDQGLHFVLPKSVLYRQGLLPF